MSIEVLDPTHEDNPESFVRANRLGSLEAMTIGLVSNGKQGTLAFFDAFERDLIDRHKATKVVRVIKANYSAPMEAAIRSQIGGWDALISGVGD